MTGPQKIRADVQRISNVLTRANNIWLAAIAEHNKALDKIRKRCKHPKFVAIEHLPGYEDDGETKCRDCGVWRSRLEKR